MMAQFLVVIIFFKKNIKIMIYVILKSKNFLDNKFEFFSITLNLTDFF